MPGERSAQRDRSESSGTDTAGAAASELVKLQRQLRIMEREQRAHNFQAHEQIRKQQLEIDQLLKEQEELHRNIGACTSAFRQQQDSEDIRSLQALLEQSDMLEDELEKEKQHHKDLQREISNMMSKPAEPRKQGGSTDDTQSTAEERIQNAITTLECKLQRASSRFSEQETKNRHLKAELNMINFEHARFKCQLNKLEEDLQEVCKTIEEITNLSMAADDARVEAQSKLIIMSEEAERDLAQYNVMIKKMEWAIANKSNLKEFMTIKCSERSGQDNSHEIGQSQLSEVKEQWRMDSGEESLDEKKEVFERIKAVTGEHNLDTLVSSFINTEHHNFTLFNIVNEQNNEAVPLRDEISQIQEEMKQFQDKRLQQAHDHRVMLGDINEQGMEAEYEAEEYEDRTLNIGKILDELKTGVNSIFSKIYHDCSVTEDMPGSSAGTSEDNVMSLLGLVEQKTDELIAMQAFLNSQNVEKDDNPEDLPEFLIGQNPELLQQCSCR